MSNPQPTIGARSGPQVIPAAAPSSLAGRKRKAVSEAVAEHNDEGIAQQPPSRAKSPKRAKLTPDDANTAAPTARPYTKATTKARNENGPRASEQSAAPRKITKSRKTKASPSADRNGTTASGAQDARKRRPAKKAKDQDAVAPEEGPDVNMADATTEQLAPSPTVARPRKRTNASLDDNDHDEDVDAAQDPMESRPKPRSKKIKTPATVQEDGDNDAEWDTRKVPRAVTGPISLASLAAGVTTTGKYSSRNRSTTLTLPGAANDDAEPSATTVAPVAPTNPGYSQTPAVAHRPAPDVAGVNLDDFFTSPLPAKVQPWNLRCPQAYGRYETAITNLIKWKAIAASGKHGRFGAIQEIDRRVYDLRAPWNHKPLSFTELAKQYNKESGKKQYSIEGLRQRFENANQIVFKTTGVYFGSLGLSEFGIPLDNDIKNANSAKKPKKAKSETAAVPDEEPITAYKKPSVHEVEVAEAAENDLELPGRTVHLLLAREVYEIVQSAIDNEAYREDAVSFEFFTDDALNRWQSCVCFGVRHTFPKRVYKLSKFAVYEMINHDPENVDGESNMGEPLTKVELLLSAPKLRQLVGRQLQRAQQKLEREIAMEEFPDHGKLEYTGDEFKYTDEGMPPVTIQALFDTYCVSQCMGTTAVSDMILDEIRCVLENEKAIDAQYAEGCICEGDCNDVVRLQDLLPQNIEKLWLGTKREDPIRVLILSLLTELTQDECERLAKAEFRNSGGIVRQLCSRTVKDGCQNDIAGFVAANSPDQFCAAYHNHGINDGCYRSMPPAALSTQMIDDSLEELNIHKVEINGVCGYKIINKTGVALDMDRLQGQTPQWEWHHIKSINSWIVANPTLAQTREPRPVFYDPSTADIDGRYPSHPGYMRPSWQPFVAENEYAKDDWNKVKHFDIPTEAERVRISKGTDDVFFELQDDEWIPPPSFATDLVRRPDQSYYEFQSFRRGRWVAEGNKIPMDTRYRWRPFNGKPDYREDTFRDATPRRRR
jgi:hypothetical protein